MDVRKNSLRYTILFLLILSIGFAIRIIKFPDIPPGFNQDEALSAYEAFSLAETGKDKWGNEWPAYFTSWGSGQSVLLAYLTIPAIKLMGLNIFSGRIISLLLGLLSLPIFFFCLRPLGRFPSYLGLFLLAVVPWHFMLSRWGLDCNLSPFFMLLGCTILSQALIKQQKKWIVLSLIPFAIALYAYGTGILVLPLFSLLIVLFYHKQIRLQLSYWLQAGVLFLITSFPFLIYFTENYIIKRNLPWTDYLFFSTPLCPSTRLSQINSIDWWEMIIKNKEFLMSGFNDGSCYNLMPGYPLLFNFVVPLLIIGFITAAFKIWKTRKELFTSSENIVLSIFLFWGIASLTLFVSFEQNVNRFNHFYLPCIVLSVWLIDYFIKKLNNHSAKHVIRFIVIIWLIIESSFVIKAYFVDYPKSNIKIEFGTGLGDAFNALKKLPEVDQIRITNHITLPYAHTLFFLQYPPDKFQLEVNVEIINGIYKVNSFGKYVFYEEYLNQDKPYGYLSWKNEYTPSEKQQKTIFFANELWEVGIITIKK